MLQAWGPLAFMQMMFWVLTKTKQKFSDMEETRLVPFSLNRIQRTIEAGIAQRNLLLKARQIGGTVYFSLRRLLLPAITDRGIGCLLVSQSGKYVMEHFEIIRRAYRYIGAADPYDDSKNVLCASLKANLLHTQYSNRRELVFDQLDSRVRVESAEVKEAAQGPTLHHVVADEYSRWPGNPEETLSNVQGAIVKPGGTLDKNCTANGAQGSFYEDCLRAMNDASKSDAKLWFFPWWWDDGYVLELSEQEKDELEKDLQSAELRVIAQMHKELKEVAWTQKPGSQRRK
jgi:hypothetical protein